ncbi:MAG: dockerin type I domain-containing protein, partial [Chthonomonadaceae bacterium]|nr:dockerin type I domain-containing protein [Chthonomonadaceae bacterium]
MAAPHVAGLAAGMIGHYNMPAWATKATIIATAYDTGWGRNNAGWGKVDTLLAHYAINGGWSTWWWDQGTTGQVRYVDFTLAQTARRVRIVLTWPDPPAAAGASVARVHDVDLGLQWGTLTTNWSANMYSSSALQTVEVIEADNLPAGTYRVKVYSYNVGSVQPVAVTVKIIDGPLPPGITQTLETPHAVRPGDWFYAKAKAMAGSHVASSVYGSIALGAGLSLDGLWYARQGDPSSNLEWVWFPSPRDTTIGYYSPFAMNQGSIAAGYTRTLWWQVRAGSSEGTRSITYTVNSRNGGTGNVTRNVIVDGTPPTTDSPRFWYWLPGLRATTYCWTRDTLAGLNVDTAYYNYSRDGGTTWSGWIVTSCTGSTPTTDWQYMYADAVPFGQNSIARNRIAYAIADAAGNWAFSPVAAVWSPVSLQGTVQLQGPISMNYPITLEFRSLDGGGTFTRNITPDAAGNFNVPSLEPRRYTVHVKGRKWLARNVTIDLTATTSGGNLGFIFLPAGDANDDNSVDVFDLNLLVASFDASEGDASWNGGAADFNNDGAVDVLDLGLLISNFDQEGDP